MARPRKESHPITVRLEQNIYDRLNDFCELSGQPKTVAIERALKEYIAVHGKQASSGAVLADKKVE